MEVDTFKTFYIGKKSKEFYISKVLKGVLFKPRANICARGRYISKAADISEHFVQNFPGRFLYNSIKISSDEYKGRIVSSICIALEFNPDFGYPAEDTYFVNSHITLEYSYRVARVYIDGLNCCRIYSLLDLDDGEEEKIHSYVRYEAYCQIIQEWAYSDYDPKLLHYEVSIPILKALYDLGYKWAEDLLITDITHRLRNGKADAVIRYYLWHYTEHNLLKFRNIRSDLKELDLPELEKCLYTDVPDVIKEYARRIQNGEDVEEIAQNFYKFDDDVQPLLYSLLLNQVKSPSVIVTNK